MTWKYIFNPFLKFSEKQLLAASVFGLLCFGFLGYVFGNPLISIFKIAEDPDLKLTTSYIYAGLSYFSAILFLLILGKIFNKKTRTVDIINTVGISQIPLLFVLIFTNLPFIKNFLTTLHDSVNVSNKLDLGIWEVAILLMFLTFTLPFLIYGIILIYNGFKTATNIKSWQKISIFAVVLIIFQIVYQLAILNLNL